eukprot:1192774-Prorocentrum_minimum.AAC.1
MEQENRAVEREPLLESPVKGVVHQSTHSTPFLAFNSSPSTPPRQPPSTMDNSPVQGIFDSPSMAFADTHPLTDTPPRSNRSPTSFEEMFSPSTPGQEQRDSEHYEGEDLMQASLSAARRSLSQPVEGVEVRASSTVTDTECT